MDKIGVQLARGLTFPMASGARGFLTRWVCLSLRQYVKTVNDLSVALFPATNIFRPSLSLDKMQCL